MEHFQLLYATGSSHDASVFSEDTEIERIKHRRVDYERGLRSGWRQLLKIAEEDYVHCAERVSVRRFRSFVVVDDR